jgi:hypothetical protein
MEDNMESNEKLALATLRTALDAVKTAARACVATDLSCMNVLDPLERIRAELAEVIAVVEGKR